MEGFERVEKIFYNLENKLGIASTGTVVCKGKFHRRDVAVKRYLNTLWCEADNQIANLLQVDYHPNIVQYLGVEFTKDFCYLALQLCQSNLEQLVTREYDNPNVETLEIMKDILNGLSYLHSLSPAIVHRDVKASNGLIFAPNSKVKPIGVLSDLGLSKQLKESQDFSMTEGVGTIGYMAPELLMINHDKDKTSQKVSIKIDIFAAGCLLYYVLSDGNHPFGENIHRRNANIIDNLPDLSKIQENGCGLKQLIGEMIAFSPNQRPNAKEIASRLCNRSTSSTVTGSYLRGNNLYLGQKKN